ncbi:MAG: hypothetical protein ACRDT4_01010 [Micromonosporaceae bacterium]
MDGPDILAQSLYWPGKPDDFGNEWQYHPRSDKHSKYACWSVLFDAMQHSALMRRHAKTGRIVVGVNLDLRDYKTNRRKRLDLVLATPAGSEPDQRTADLSDLALRWGIRLTDEQKGRLADLPPLAVGSTAMVLAALEAKACMTAHIKALPRLFDELNSSHLTVHANTAGAIAAGFTMVNVSDTFISPDRNKHPLATVNAVVSTHKQPLWAERAIQKLKELPRRTRQHEDGFDAFGISVVNMRNDGGPVRVGTDHPAPGPQDVYHYDQMVRRLVHLYDTRYGDL